ncbi:pentapeptide repeat-containing protein [Paenibacillus guangzhouensis]|uniref:pentapeptide repeat-containing protein n=1 Tax=Paenibacillus guangzhouensis TaxID=1473112 RepID=UPI0012669B20|nr:pentapeptide repeat-containing protein [Paenibacillus guangzhouensis]
MTTYNSQSIIDKLESHRLWVETIGKQGGKLGIDEIDLRDMDLTKYMLDQAYITECIFDGMYLQGKDFHSSVLCSSSFKTTNLLNTDFYRADLSYADFSDANLENARLAKADCSETLFSKANLANANLMACSLYLTDFRNAILTNANISSASFKGTLLKGAELSGITGIEDALIKSINIGTSENPIILEDEEAARWLKNTSTSL